MGLLFLVFGLNGFFNFIPQPKTPMPEGAVAFVGALMKTSYMMPLVMGTQLLVGLLLLSHFGDNFGRRSSQVAERFSLELDLNLIGLHLERAAQE